MAPYHGDVFAVLFLAFVVLPVLEVYVIVQVAGGIGWAETILLVILISVIGAALVKMQGIAIWVRFQTQLGQGKMPGNELVDGALVLVAATLMLTPGFITDAVGLFLLVPFTRALVRRPILSRVKARAENHSAYRVWQGGPGVYWTSERTVADTDVVRDDEGDIYEGTPPDELER